MVNQSVVLGIYSAVYEAQVCYRVNLFIVYFSGQKIASLGEHKSFVQGVAWDPKNKLAATLSSDRFVSFYPFLTLNRAFVFS